MYVIRNLEDRRVNEKIIKTFNKSRERFSRVWSSNVIYRRKRFGSKEGIRVGSRRPEGRLVEIGRRNVTDGQV